LGRKPKLSLEVIEQLKAQGLTQKEIADKLGVTRQAVSWWIRYHGGAISPRKELLETHFPWKVPGDMSETSLLRRLRDHGEWVATGGEGMSESKISRLFGFYRKLQDYVVEFDPTLPPEPGIAPHGGFALRKRTVRDRGLMIRVNKYTQLTEEGQRIWALPRPMLPKEEDE
jgi:transcriptional regulator with XRE-family HTH domain